MQWICGINSYHPHNLTLKNTFFGRLLWGRGSFATTSRPLPGAPDEDGFTPINTLWNVSPQFNNIVDEQAKLTAVLTNPAVLKVFTLQCDLFSLGRVKVLSKGSKEQPNDPALALLTNPNPMQSGNQLLWDYMFNLMLGTSHCYLDSNTAENPSNKLYILQTSKLEFPQELVKRKDKLIFSKAAENEIMRMQVKYKYEDGTTIEIPISKLISMTDLSNGNGNWFAGNSRLDALWKIISNVEATIEADNINTRFTGKFMVAGTQDPNNVTQVPLTDDEKLSIEQKMNGSRSVHAVKSMIDVKRFVDNLRNLELGKQYAEKYYVIASMFGIPKDVAEAYLDKGATFENQEKAVGRHISYTLQPKGNDFMARLAARWGYPEQGKAITISWDHLPFMQVFEKEKAALQQTKIGTMTAMLRAGIDLAEINKFLGTDFKTGQYEQPKQQSQ